MAHHAPVAGLGLPMHDSFAAPARPGALVGTATAAGVPRHVVDAEGVIGADNGALRIQPLVEPGWGRAGIAYGPYARSGGLAFVVSMLNGHNTAQSENLTETFRARLDRWLAGPEVHRRRERLLTWLRSRRKARMLRQWRWWWRARKGAVPVPRIDENLALGWFATARPGDPVHEGNALVMHATGAENGELRVRTGPALLPAVRGVQNLPMHYVVVLREQGAAYYAASLPGSRGLGHHPALRPLGIDAFHADPQVYAGLFQSTLGQIGFRLDTRVYGLRVAPVPAWSHWFGSAHAADRCTGSGNVTDTAAEVGGRWHTPNGDGPRRSPRGLVAAAGDGLAWLQPSAPSGLLHVIVEAGVNSAASASLVWRCADAANHWQLLLSGAGCELAVRVQGQWTQLAHDASVALRAGVAHSVQILDDGRSIGLHLDGALLFGRRFDDVRLQDAAGVGLALTGPAEAIWLRQFEAHPRSCPLPPELALAMPPWRLGTEAVLTECFEGGPRALADKPASKGSAVWRRTMGTGHIDLVGDGSARVRADASHPNPGRLAYTVAWAEAGFADLEVEITPPGSRRGEREHGRAGLVFWQDDDNFILVNNWLNDSYGGASVSCFSCLGGFEDLYDAVWTNVGERVRWGAAHRFRVAFDGMHLLALVDDEPVLYRALTDIYADAPRLQIRRVGLIANWEWGNDTGSTFRRFLARV
ncbi:MAG: hypothetical protein Q8K45_06130 [Rubrivivax sp.]|nr:hypothetical protein [Rubrivivax sp.]